MTGIEALQALREGKKVTNSTMPSFFAVVLTREKDGAPYTRIVWIPFHEADENWVYAWCGGDPFDGSDFLMDDWEIVK